MKKVIVVFLLMSSAVFSQKTIEDQAVWFAYTGQYKVSKNWGYHIEAQFRMDNELEKNFQNLYRIGAIYYLPNKTSISSGYSLVKTFSNKADEFLTENRIWEQFQTNKNWSNKKNAMQQRVRLEQRFVEVFHNNPELQNTFEYQNRVRYLNRNLFHLAEMFSSKEQFYLILQNEMFFNLGDNKINANFIDQNRFLVGLGINYQNNIRFEIGYLNHFVTSDKINDLMRHTISVSLIQNIDLFQQN